MKHYLIYAMASLCITLLFTTACAQEESLPKDDTDSSSDPAAEGQTQTQTQTPQPTALDVDKTLLTANGDKLTVGELLAYREIRQGIPLPQDTMQAQDTLINELLSTLLLAQEAQKIEGFEDDKLVKAALKLARLQALREIAINHYISNLSISDEEVKKLYDAEYQQIDETQYKASHILLEDEAKAKEMIEQLDKDTDFAELAKQNSTGPTGSQGGDLGWFSLNSMVPPFSKALATLNKGEYTKTPVKTEFGWHVIMLEDTRENTVKPPEFEIVKDQLLQHIQIMRMREHLNELQKQAKIEIPEDSDLSIRSMEGMKDNGANDKSSEENEKK